MLTKLKKHVLNAMYDYHYNRANYCYGKVDEYGPEHNRRWENKVMKHTIMEMVIADKLSKMGES